MNTVASDGPGSDYRWGGQWLPKGRDNGYCWDRQCRQPLGRAVVIAGADSAYQCYVIVIFKLWKICVDRIKNEEHFILF